MPDEIIDVFIRELPGDLPPRAQRALIKALIMVTYADLRIRSEKTDNLDRVLAEIDWGNERELATFVARHQSAEIVDEGSTFARGYRLEFPLVRVGGIERDPEEDEAGVIVVTTRLGTSDPADGAMCAQTHCLGKATANGALLGFQRRVVENILHT